MSNILFYDFFKRTGPFKTHISQQMLFKISFKLNTCLNQKIKVILF